jgi:hypothetical protein
MASPATFLTAANERIHFTKHSSGSAFNLLQSHSQHKCRTSTVALEDVNPRLGRGETQRNKTRHKRFFLESVKNQRTAAQLLCALRHAWLQHAAPGLHVALRIGGMRRSKRRVLRSNAALAKAVRGVERWTYL